MLLICFFLLSWKFILLSLKSFKCITCQLYYYWAYFITCKHIVLYCVLQHPYHNTYCIGSEPAIRSPTFQCYNSKVTYNNTIICHAVSDLLHFPGFCQNENMHFMAFWHLFPIMMLITLRNTGYFAPKIWTVKSRVKCFVFKIVRQNFDA